MNDVIDEKLTFDSRITEMFFQFSLFLPIYNKQERIAIRSMTGQDMAEFIPQYFMDVAIACTKDVKLFEVYARWIRDAITYALHESDESPPLGNFSSEKYQALKNLVISNRRMLLKKAQKESRKNK